jgi:hypothetical protein
MEIIIAAVIIVVALIPLFGVFKFSSRSTESMNNRSIATKFASGICDEVAHQDFKLLEETAGGAGDLTDLYPLTSDEMAKDEYVRFEAEAKLVPGDDENHIQLNINVSWTDIKGTGDVGSSEEMERTVKLSRMIVNPTPITWVMTGTTADPGTGTGSGSGSGAGTDLGPDTGTGTPDADDEDMDGDYYLGDEAGGIYSEVDQYIKDNKDDPSTESTRKKLVELRLELQKAEGNEDTAKANRARNEINDILHPPEDESAE